jgi:hypothetical protein
MSLGTKNWPSIVKVTYLSLFFYWTNIQCQNVRKALFLNAFGKSKCKKTVLKVGPFYALSGKIQHPFGHGFVRFVRPLTFPLDPPILSYAA